MAPTNRVLVKESSHVRTITLNRPKQLNVLSIEMLSHLFELFHAYEEDPNVKLIIMKGEGKDFCAGGDIVALIQEIDKADWKVGAQMYTKAYTLNYLIATYDKPQVSLLRGIVMGGGAGASILSRFRVATDTSRRAIGLFPDVGASYYLLRLPGFFGEYVGLTGARLDGAEMLACGLATHFVPLEKLSSLQEALRKEKTGDPKLISNIINEFSYTPKLKEKSQYLRLRTINECFSKRTVEEIIFALEKEGDRKMDQWIATTLKFLKKASPTSLKISLCSIREGRLQGVGQCLIREYRIGCHILRGQLSKDVNEGCRALLVDKDNNPKWKPSKLEFVDEQMVDHHFEPLDDKDWEDLELPFRSNLPSHVIPKL